MEWGGKLVIEMICGDVIIRALTRVDRVLSFFLDGLQLCRSLLYDDKLIAHALPC